MSDGAEAAPGTVARGGIGAAGEGSGSGAQAMSGPYSQAAMSQAGGSGGPPVKKVKVPAGSTSNGGNYSPYTSGHVSHQFTVDLSTVAGDSVMEKGVRALNEGRLSEALNQFAIALMRDPDNIQARNLRDYARELKGLPPLKDEKAKEPVVEERRVSPARDPAVPKPAPRKNVTGVYTMTGSGLETRKHELARSTSVIDTGLDMKRMVMLIVSIGIFVGAALYIGFIM